MIHLKIATIKQWSYNINIVQWRCKDSGLEEQEGQDVFSTLERTSVPSCFKWHLLSFNVINLLLINYSWLSTSCVLWFCSNQLLYFRLDVVRFLVYIWMSLEKYRYIYHHYQAVFTPRATLHTKSELTPRHTSSHEHQALSSASSKKSLTVVMRQVTSCRNLTANQSGDCRTHRAHSASCR